MVVACMDRRNRTKLESVCVCCVAANQTSVVSKATYLISMHNLVCTICLFCNNCNCVRIERIKTII